MIISLDFFNPVWKKKNIKLIIRSIFSDLKIDPYVFIWNKRIYKKKDVADDVPKNWKRVLYTLIEIMVLKFLLNLFGS